MAMTWPRLRSKTYSMIGRTIRATVHYSDGSTGQAWNAPERWRLDDADGVTKQLNNAVGYFFRDEDGSMRLIPKSPTTIVSFASDGDNPRYLLEPQRFWYPTVFEDLMRTPSRITEVTHDGRRAWSAEFDDIAFTIDDETGIALSYAGFGGSMSLSDPVLDELFPNAVFSWSGPVEEAETRYADARYAHEVERRLRAETMEMTLPTWLPVTVRGHVIDGDPATGALDARFTGIARDAVLRRWPTAIPEPVFGMDEQFPVTARSQCGPWTVEARLGAGADSIDAAGIVESVGALPDITLSSAELRKRAARATIEKNEIELNLCLGEAKSLDEYRTGYGDCALYIRSDFGDDDAWHRAALALITDREKYGRPDCRMVVEREAEDITRERLVELYGETGPAIVFVADSVTMAHDEIPFLVVDVCSSSRTCGQTFRAALAATHSVEANLTLSNLSFDDFAAAAGRSADGVYRD